MPRIAGVTLGVLALLLASQVALPWLAERRVADRLEQRGGSADVSISVFPALRLLFEDGDRFEVEGDGLRLDPRRRLEALERLDGFDEVSVRLDEIDAGPLAVSSFVLERDEGEDDYELGMEAVTTPREVGAFLGSEAGGTFGGILGDFAGGSLPGGGDTEIPIELDAVVASRDGRIEVDRVSGSLAGIPAGPLAELVVGAVADRL